MGERGDGSQGRKRIEAERESRGEKEVEVVRERCD